MSELPLISVIIPVYNYAAYVAEAVRSAEEQDGPFRLEIVAVDDGSTDGSPAVLARLAAEPGSRLRVIRQENAGLSAARNTGLAHAGGEFIQFLDADDLLAPECLRSQLAALEAHPDVDASVCACLGLSRAGSAMWQLCADSHALRLCGGNIAPAMCFLLRRRFTDGVGRFDTGLTSLEDHDYWLRGAALGGRFRTNAEAMVIYRLHGSGMSGNADVMAAMGREVLLRASSLLRSVPAGVFPPEGRASGLLVNGSALLGCAFSTLDGGDSPERRAVARVLARHAARNLHDALGGDGAPLADNPACRLAAYHFRMFSPHFPEAAELDGLDGMLAAIFPDVMSLPLDAGTLREMGEAGCVPAGILDTLMRRHAAAHAGAFSPKTAVQTK